MIEKFLKAKHWQLFLLTFGIPMIIQIILMSSIMSAVIKEGEPNIEFMLNYMKFIPLIMIFFALIYFGWFWSVGVGLDKLIPDRLKLKVGRFKLFLLFPLIYIFFFTTFMVYAMSSVLNSNVDPIFNNFMFIIPMHLFSMFCIFYCLYFVAKTIKTAEMQKEVSFGDFAGEFFLIWFFPIGVWILQPKINKMLADENEAVNNFLIKNE